MRKLRSKENGIAMVLAMFMVLIMSTLGVSLMFTSQTETWSSQNYKMMSQARYAAESGIQSAANYLMFSYTPPLLTDPNDPLAAYKYQFVTPVKVLAGLTDVVLATDVNAANYPYGVVRTNFHNATVGSLVIDNASAAYTVSARLVSMENFEDYIKKKVTIQTWRLTGKGTISGARTGETEVVATLERPKSPAFGYAAFATDNGCGALSFNGGATTDSYDSSNGVDPMTSQPTTQDYGGAVGTNGNLTDVGAGTMINGTLSTPRSGVGNCSNSNVTAVTDPSQVQDGLIPLAQPMTFPTPDPVNPLPPTGNVNFNGGSCAGLAAPVCTLNAAGQKVIHPTATGLQTTDAKPLVLMADVTMGGGAAQVVHLEAGVYNVNSLTQNGNATLVIDSGPVVINIAGVGQNVVLKLNGNGISNTLGGQYDPMMLQFVYAGDQQMILDGGSQTCALIYAPNASSKFAGSVTDFYGAVVTKYVTETGGAAIHYDRRLGGEAFIAGNWTLSAFTWKKY